MISGLTVDTNRLMNDLKQRQVEKRLVEDDQDQPRNQSNSEVKISSVEGEGDVWHVQSESPEAPAEGGKASVRRVKSLGETEKKEFFPKPSFPYFSEDTDERDGASLRKILKPNTEMNSKLITIHS